MAAVVRLAASTSPWNRTVPVVLDSVTEPALTVDWKVAPPELVTVRAPSILTAPVDVMVPEEPRLTVTDSDPPPAVPVTEPMLTDPLPPWPSVSVTALARVTAPSVTEPVPAAMAMSPVTVTGEARLTGLLVVTMSPARRTEPEPFWVKPPVAVMSPAAPEENRPPLVTVTVPWADRPAFTARAAPVNARSPVRVTAPPRVVVPVPASWVKAVALSVLGEASVTLLAETTRMASSAEPDPIFWLKAMFPAPAISVRS